MTIELKQVSGTVNELITVFGEPAHELVKADLQSAAKAAAEKVNAMERTFVFVKVADTGSWALGDAAWQVGMGLEPSNSLFYGPGQPLLVIDSVPSSSEASALGVTAGEVLISVGGRRVAGLNKVKVNELIVKAVRPMTVVTLPAAGASEYLEALRLRTEAAVIQPSEMCFVNPHVQLCAPDMECMRAEVSHHCSRLNELVSTLREWMKVEAAASKHVPMARAQLCVEIARAWTFTPRMPVPIDPCAGTPMPRPPGRRLSQVSSFGLWVVKTFSTPESAAKNAHAHKMLLQLAHANGKHTKDKSISTLVQTKQSKSKDGNLGKQLVMSKWLEKTPRTTSASYDPKSLALMGEPWTVNAVPDDFLFMRDARAPLRREPQEPARMTIAEFEKVRVALAHAPHRPPPLPETARLLPPHGSHQSRWRASAGHSPRHDVQVLCRWSHGLCWKGFARLVHGEAALRRVQ